jgi:phenylalanine-4-hydroxylase
MEPSSLCANGASRSGDIPGDLLAYVTGEAYESHAEAAHDVWREVLRRNRDLIREHAQWMHPTYVEGQRALALPERIPRVDELNERLEPTGWRILPVAGYIPTAAYAGLMSRSIFPVSRVIRRAEHIDFAPAPDMVHDILGHLPLLFSAEYREFLRQLASVMTRAVPNELDQEFYEAVRRMAELKSESSAPAAEVARAEARVNRVNHALGGRASEVTCLRRMYVWSIEFGLLGDCREFSVHGAALLSSPHEFHAARSGRARISPYSLAVVHHENTFSDLLGQYFVATDFSQLRAVLTEYAGRMQQSETVDSGIAG